MVATSGFSGVPKRTRGVEKKTTTLAIEKRLYLHAKDHLNIPLTTEAAFRTALESRGIDYLKPHDSEVWSLADPLDPIGKPVTWGEARAQGLVDAKGRSQHVADGDEPLVGP